MTWGGHVASPGLHFLVGNMEIKVPASHNTMNSCLSAICKPEQLTVDRLADEQQNFLSRSCGGWKSETGVAVPGFCEGLLWVGPSRGGWRAGELFCKGAHPFLEN